MAVEITYFVHGTTTDNEGGVSTGWLPGELSEVGVEQAKELGHLVRDQKFDVVFCSDLKRAVDSAELGFGEEYLIVSDARLRECNYGELCGGPTSNVEAVQEQRVKEKFPQGESYSDVEARMADFLTMLKRDYDNKHVGIVAHQAPQLALDVLLKGKSWERAFAEDWRKSKAWQAGWDYTLE